jgi:hypothetical protein
MSASAHRVGERERLCWVGICLSAYGQAAYFRSWRRAAVDESFCRRRSIASAACPGDKPAIWHAHEVPHSSEQTCSPPSRSRLESQHGRARGEHCRPAKRGNKDSGMQSFTTGGEQIAVEWFAASGSLTARQGPSSARPAVLLLHGADSLTYADSYRLATRTIAAVSVVR